MYMTSKKKCGLREEPEWLPCSCSVDESPASSIGGTSFGAVMKTEKEKLLKEDVSIDSFYFSSCTIIS